MQIKHLLSLAALALFATSSVAAESETFPAYQLSNTTVHTVPMPSAKRVYQLLVDVPPTYAESKKKFPVVFVTDANYAFPLVRSIRARLGARGQNIEDFILVGLAYADGNTPAESRNRDYTPTDPLLNPKRDPKTYSATTYGEAAAYRDYVEQHVFPLIAKHYRADMQRKVYAGHSYGGLFGLYTLFTKPEMFQTYILGSPSIWFDDRVIKRHEQDYANAHKNLAARVHLYTGAYESLGKGARYNTKVDAVRDMRALVQKLQSRRYANLTISADVIADEDHLSVYPALISRGLVKVLPGFGPYTGG